MTDLAFKDAVTMVDGDWIVPERCTIVSWPKPFLLDRESACIQVQFDDGRLHTVCMKLPSIDVTSK